MRNFGKTGGMNFIRRDVRCKNDIPPIFLCKNVNKKCNLSEIFHNAIIKLTNNLKGEERYENK